MDGLRSAPVDPRENLAAAIRDYAQWAHGRPGQADLLSRMEELRVEVEQAPSPVSQGPGSVPTTKPGGSGQREPETVKVALAMLQNAHGSAHSGA